VIRGEKGGEEEEREEGCEDWRGGSIEEADRKADMKMLQERGLEAEHDESRYNRKQKLCEGPQSSSGRQ
jgi:hypothetical protein